jgi:hypothetical protein
VRGQWPGSPAPAIGKSLIVIEFDKTPLFYPDRMAITSSRSIQAGSPDLLYPRLGQK